MAIKDKCNSVAYKSKFILVLTLFSMIFMISFVSAWDWDNIKEYVPEEDRIDIYNSWIIPNVIKGTKLAEIKLIENSDLCIENCHAILEVKLLTDYENIIPSFETYEVNDKTKVKKINAYRIRIRDNGTLRMVDDYEKVCDTREVWNGTEEYNCTMVEVGNHPETEYQYNKYEGEYLTAGTYLFKITGTKDRKESVDWIASIMGVETTEWAVWSASFQEGLIFYHNCTSAVAVAGGSAFDFEVLASDPVYAVGEGIVGDGCSFDGDDKLIISEQNQLHLNHTSGNTTIAFWVKLNATTSWGLMGKEDGSGGADAPSMLITTDKIAGNFLSGSDSGWLEMDAVPDTQVWYFVVYQSNDTNTSLWINGTHQTEIHAVGTPETSIINWTFGDRGQADIPSQITMDEIAIWNRSLSATEITDLYNGGAGLTYVEEGIEDSPIATLVIPINDTNQSTSSVTFNYTCADDYMIDNSTFYIDGVLNRTDILGSVNYSSLEFSLPFPDGSYIWNVNCTDNATTTQITDSGIRSFEIDTTDPVIGAIGNLTNQVVFELPFNSTWNYSVSDDNLQNCWYNTTDNATIGIVTCNSTIYTQWETEGSKTLYYWVNDSFGNEASGSTPINITLIALDYAHNPDAVGELGYLFFSLYVNKTDTETTTAYLWINNTLYNVDNTDAYENYTYFNYTFTVPDGWGNSTGWEYDYYWNATIDGVLNNQSTTGDNFTVYSMEMDNCSAFDIEILRFNLFDEESNELVNASAGANIEVDILMELGGGSWTFHDEIPNNETTRVCVPEGTINNTNYTIGYTIGFDSTDRVWEFFYVDGGILDNNNELLDAQTNRTISLYDLLSADSTSFLFNYFNEDGLPEEDSIVHVFRKYIGEGLFREVERARQDENGDTTVHLVEEDVIYYFVITLDGEILYTSSTYTALCQAVPCTIQIEASGDLVEFGDDWDLVANGSYSLTQSSLIRLVNLTYAFTESADANLTLYRYDSDGDYVSIISGEETGTSGTISLLVPSSIGNKTFFATIYKDDEFIRSEWISMEEDAGLYFGNSLALFLAFLIILSLGLMAISEGGATIVWVIIGMIITSALGLIDFATSTGVSLLIYFVCAGAIILFKLTRGRK